MPHHCTEAAHFFIFVYVILLGLSSVYLSVGFPCNPWADLVWDKGRGGLSEFGHVSSGKSRGCWRDCQAYALRLHILRNPEILDGNPRVSLVNSLLAPIQPNPFCYTSSHLLPDLGGNPFCSRGLSQVTPRNSTRPPQVTEKEFRQKKQENGRLHSFVLVALCLDCIVVSLSILLIYISTLPQSHVYGLTFLVTFLSHVLSLFLSSHVAKWLTCVQPGTNARFCDATESIITAYATNLRVHLPEKASGVSNFEISLVIKNVNMVCLMFGGLCYFSLRRSFEGGLGQMGGGDAPPPPDGQPRDGGGVRPGQGVDDEADSPAEGD